MKKKQYTFQELKNIYNTYLNGNISDAKERVKKLTLNGRKSLYVQVGMKFTNEEWDFTSKDAIFFFNLI